MDNDPALIAALIVLFSWTFLFGWLAWTVVGEPIWKELTYPFWFGFEALERRGQLENKKDDLVTFFRALGIDRLTTQRPFGGEADWSWIHPNKVSGHVMRKAEEWNEPYEIWQKPKGDYARQPFVELKGKTYTFLEALYQEGRILLSGTVQAEGQEAKQLNMPVAEWRVVLGV